MVNVAKTRRKKPKNVFRKEKLEKILRTVGSITNSFGYKILAISEYLVFNKFTRYFIITEDGNKQKQIFTVCIYNGNCYLTQVMKYGMQEFMLSLIYIQLYKLIKPINSILILPDMFSKYIKKENIQDCIPTYLNQFRSIYDIQ